MTTPRVTVPVDDWKHVIGALKNAKARLGPGAAVCNVSAALTKVEHLSAAPALEGGADFYAVKAAIERAMMDERDGNPCGCIIEAGCEARGYADPAYAASGFIWAATDTVVRALATREEAPAEAAELDPATVTLEWSKIETLALEEWRAEFGDYVALATLGHDSVWSYRVNNRGRLHFADASAAKDAALADLRERLAARLLKARATVALYDTATRKEARAEAGEQSGGRIAFDAWNGRDGDPYWFLESDAWRQRWERVAVALFAHPAPDALRVSVDDALHFYALGQQDAGHRAKQALAALQAEQKGGA